MKTYQDLLETGKSERARMDFAIQAINEHTSSLSYRIASDAELYYKHQNPTIMRAQKMVYNMLGKAVPDFWSANNKIPCRYYYYFVTQLVQYLLGNGVFFTNENTKEQLGGDDFDIKISKLAIHALNGSAGFAFFNLDHIDIFSFLEFVPLYDEENGALMAGVRFWQIAPDKPLRFTLYEPDGYTDYIRRSEEEPRILHPKRTYKQIKISSDADGERIYSGENYDGFPIVPLYNTNKQSELVGGKETIDAYDLMASQLVNDCDDGNLIYWVLKNCNWMTPEDDAQFLEQLRVTHVVHAGGDEGASVEAHKVDAPYNANEAALSFLKKQLFDDFMALDVTQISSGSVTATQINAAYEPLNSKADQFEYQLIEFIQGVLKIAGIEDTPSFKRSRIVNQSEETQMVLMAASYLDDRTILKKLPWLSPEEVEEVLARKEIEEATRFEPDEEFQEPDTEQEEGAIDS